MKIPRLKHIREGIYFERQALGKMLDGTLQEITDYNMQQTVWKAWKHLGADKRVSHAISADLGLGLGKPLLFFSQLYFSRGMHFGIEFDKRLHLPANRNLKCVTLKGWANVDGGLIAKDNIK